MSGHTPGPWEVVPPLSDGANSMRIFTKDGKYIAIAGGSDQAFEEIAANARLIAAAPELLHCLTRIIDELPAHRDWLDPSLEAHARAVISKATGETP